MATKNCLKCLNSFILKYSKNKKFCSRICSGKNNQKISHICYRCNVEFFRKPSDREAKYCSKKCQMLNNPKVKLFEIGNTINRKEKYEFLCKLCNSKFYVLPHLINQRYCSRKCQASSIAKNHSRNIQENKIKFLARNYEKFVIRNENGCWGWEGSKNKKGYGNSSGTRAHRVSYMIHIGDIPKGMFVLHKCDNPQCTRPSCLFLGDNKANMQDMIKKGRAAWQKNKPITFEELK